MHRGISHGVWDIGCETHLILATAFGVFRLQNTVRQSQIGFELLVALGPVRKQELICCISVLYKKVRNKKIEQLTCYDMHIDMR